MQIMHTCKFKPMCKIGSNMYKFNFGLKSRTLFATKQGVVSVISEGFEV